MNIYFVTSMLYGSLLGALCGGIWILGKVRRLNNEGKHVPVYLLRLTGTKSGGLPLPGGKHSVILSRVISVIFMVFFLVTLTDRTHVSSLSSAVSFPVPLVSTWGISVLFLEYSLQRG